VNRMQKEYRETMATATSKVTSKTAPAKGKKGARGKADEALASAFNHPLPKAEAKAVVNAEARPPAPVRRTRSAGRRDDEALAAAFKHLGDATRLRVLRRIAEGGPTNVTELGAEVGMSQPATSHHLAILRHARIIDGVREGKSVIYNLTKRGEVLAKVVADLSKLGCRAVPCRSLSFRNRAFVFFNKGDTLDKLESLENPNKKPRSPGVGVGVGAVRRAARGPGGVF
jgi:DNA-binding transcriptional ArsR family regulator